MAAISSGHRVLSALGCVLHPKLGRVTCRSISQHCMSAKKALRQLGKQRRNTARWKQEIEDREMKINMYSFDIQSLATRGFLRSTKPYAPPPDVESRLNDIATDTLPKLAVTEDLQSISLKDPTVKYKFLVKCIKDFEHDIPSSQLHKMNTIGDVTAYFKQPVKTTTTYDDLSKSSNLPPNLHIQPEPYRFNPETDTLFGGITAYPGRATIVTGLKAKRLFKGYTPPSIVNKFKV